MEVIRMESDTKKRGVVYARVNKCAQDNLGPQILACQAKMKNEMVKEVHAPIIDIGSGTNFEKSGLEELQELARSGSIDYLYISALDRLGRDSLKTLQILKCLEESDVTVKTIDGEFAFSDFACIFSSMLE